MNKCATAILLVIISFLSCSKSGQKGNADASTASVSLTNAVADRGDLFFTEVDSAIHYGNPVKLTVKAGLNSIKTYPVGHPDQGQFVNNYLTLPGEKYSLILTGESGFILTYILLRDTLQSISGNSTAIRFITASPDADSVSINLKGQPFGSISGPLGFARHTSFIEFPVSDLQIQYAFEFRKASNDSLLLEYDFSPALTHHVTIVFDGIASNRTLTAFPLFID